MFADLRRLRDLRRYRPTTSKACEINRKSFVICSLISAIWEISVTVDQPHPHGLPLWRTSAERVARGLQSASLQARGSASLTKSGTPTSAVGSGPTTSTWGRAVGGEHQRMRKSGDDGGRQFRHSSGSGGDNGHPSSSARRKGGTTFECGDGGTKRVRWMLGSGERIDSKVQFYPSHYHMLNRYLHMWGRGTKQYHLLDRARSTVKYGTASLQGLWKVSLKNTQGWHCTSNLWPKIGGKDKYITTRQGLTTMNIATVIFAFPFGLGSILSLVGIRNIHIRQGNKFCKKYVPCRPALAPSEIDGKVDQQPIQAPSNIARVFHSRRGSYSL